MNSPAHSSSQPAVARDRAEQQEIDASAKWPVLVFFGSALLWLIIGGALQLAASIQLHTPAFLADCEWFTHGRIAPAAQNALVYGWGMNAGFAFALWLMARLSAAALRSAGWLMVAAVFWNLGVFLGLAGILGGYSTSYELLEMPSFASLLLLGSYLMIGVWAVTTFSVRNTEKVYASQWYILGAAFWFPWLFLVARLMLSTSPVNGVVQSIVNVWYVNGLLNLWFVPLALAAAYYFLPKILGKPIYDYYVAVIGFWWFAICSACSAGSRLIGGPVPAWVATLGSAASMLVIAAVVIIGVNLLGTLCGNFAKAQKSTTLRFIVLSIVGFMLAAALNFALSVRSFAEMAQFTFIPELRDWLLLYACFSTAMFGAAYFFLPRVTGKVWRAPVLISTHYAATALGVLALTVGLFVAGWKQGHQLNLSDVNFATITNEITPWLTYRSVALMLLSIGHLAFLINFVWIACPCCSPCTTAATIKNPPEMEAHQA